MGQTRWTPGPWKFYQESACILAGFVEVLADIDIASGVDDDAQREADAYLIAAAPELYGALDETVRAMGAVMRAIVEEDEAVVNRITTRAAKFNGFGVRANAALAKARGQMPNVERESVEQEE